MHARVVMTFLLCLAAVGHDVGDAVAEVTPQAAQTTKKARYFADKQASAVKAIPRVSARAEAVLNIHNTWTDETLPIALTGNVNLPAETINHFLRCHFTNQATTMAPALFDVLRQAAKKFSSKRIEIVSGFRAPKYNLMLRKKGHEVARSSQHLLGHAVDFRIPGVAAATLRKWATKLRLGGVGFYPGSNFIHVDVGPVRQWTGE